MIILDTNVVSELQKKEPDERVIAWLDAQEPTNLFLTAISVEELLLGVHLLPPGKRMQQLSTAVEAILQVDFKGRILPYDATAAMYYGMRISDARKQGYTIGHADGQIAAIAIANKHAPVATRDRKPFDALRVDVINPWDYDL